MKYQYHTDVLLPLINTGSTDLNGLSPDVQELAPGSESKFSKVSIAQGAYQEDLTMFGARTRGRADGPPILSTGIAND